MGLQYLNDVAGRIVVCAVTDHHVHQDDTDIPILKRGDDVVIANGRINHRMRFALGVLVVAKVQEGLDTAASFVVRNYSGEFSAVVSGTISRWDGEETADRLELLLGPDLQFIRINGTLVGGLAGLLLHTIAELLA